MNGWLRDPRLYGLLQRAVTRRGCWNIFIERYLRPVPGERLLDLGCGTGLLTDYLPPLDYWGLDADPEYIRFAQKKTGNQRKFLCADLNRTPWPVSGPFDRAMATGLLHHLPDEQVVGVMENVRKLLKPRARFVTFDGCYEQRQSPAARWLLSMDRGKYVRTPEAYLALARVVFPRVEFHIERRLLRVPYSHLIMESSVE